MLSQGSEILHREIQINMFQGRKLGWDIVGMVWGGENPVRYQFFQSNEIFQIHVTLFKCILLYLVVYCPCICLSMFGIHTSYDNI